MEPEGLLQVEEWGRLGQSGVIWKGPNDPSLALKMEENGYEPRNVGEFALSH